MVCLTDKQKVTLEMIDSLSKWMNQQDEKVFFPLLWRKITKGLS